MVSSSERSVVSQDCRYQYLRGVSKDLPVSYSDRLNEISNVLTWLKTICRHVLSPAVPGRIPPLQTQGWRLRFRFNFNFAQTPPELKDFSSSSHLWDICFDKYHHRQILLCWKNADKGCLPKYRDIEVVASEAGTIVTNLGQAAANLGINVPS